MIITFAEDAISLSYFVAACIMLCIATFMISKLRDDFLQNKYLSSVINNLFQTAITSLLEKKAKYIWNCCFIAVLYQSVIENIQNQCL